ncbi:hypothetical protein ACLB2K_001429 [Fragaria x ananassa]
MVAQFQHIEFTHIWREVNFVANALGSLGHFMDAGYWLDSSFGYSPGCLCVSRFPKGAWDYMELWVMKEYEVSDSWTMQFRLELSELKALMPTEVLVLESSIVSRNWTAGGYELLRIDHKEDNKRWRYILEGRQCSLIEYEESLLWISGYQSVKETEQAGLALTLQWRKHKTYQRDCTRHLLQTARVDADTPSFGNPSSARKLTLPLPGDYVHLLGSLYLLIGNSIISGTHRLDSSRN